MFCLPSLFRIHQGVSDLLNIGLDDDTEGLRVASILLTHYLNSHSHSTDNCTDLLIFYSACYLTYTCTAFIQLSQALKKCLWTTIHIIFEGCIHWDR